MIADLNPVLRGWGSYFRTGNAAIKFQQVDGYVWFRLKRLMLKKHGRNLHTGQAAVWTQDWFIGHGLYTPGHRPLSEDRVTRSRKSSVSRVRENRTHGLKGDEGNGSARTPRLQLPMATRRPPGATTLVLAMPMTPAAARRRMALARTLMFLLAVFFAVGTAWFAAMTAKFQPLCLSACSATPGGIGRPAMYVLCVLPALHAAGWLSAYRKTGRRTRVVGLGVALSLLPVLGTVLGLWAVASTGTSSDGAFAVALTVVSAVPLGLAVVVLRILRSEAPRVAAGYSGR